MWQRTWLCACTLLLAVFIPKATSSGSEVMADYQLQWCRYETLFPIWKGIEYGGAPMKEITDTFDETIKWIDASNSGVEVFSPKTLENATQLVRLDLSKNSIRQLDDFVFSEATNLRFLELSVNKISTISEQAFGDLNKLEYLSLVYNKIASLPPNVFRPLTKLRNLDLGHNPITALPNDIFKHNHNLINIYLSYDAIQTLPVDLFESQSSLETLYLESLPLDTLSYDVFNPLKSIEKVYVNKDLMDKFPKIPKATVWTKLCVYEFIGYSGSCNIDNTVLNISNSNTHELIATQAGITEVSINSDRPLELRRLFLSRNSLKAVGVISSIVTLEVLDLSYNPLGKLNPTDFVNLKNIKELSLSATGLYYLPDGVFNQLINLRRLDISMNAIEVLKSKSVPVTPAEYIVEGNPLKRLSSSDFFLRFDLAEKDTAAMQDITEWN